PGLDGVELTEKIRALSSNTAVIWITAYGCHKVEAEAARLSVYECLEKPLKVTEIRRVVQEALSSTDGQASTSKQ
ncbi:MAG: response regulator, partial [Anaerolineae bacterium]|nr:response regulator [Anaerolineae bacterium]